MADHPPPRPPDRFQVRAGVMQESGEPFIEIVDNLAVQSMTLDIPTALLIASGINQMVAKLMITAQEQARHQQRGIVVPRSTMAKVG